MPELPEVESARAAIERSALHRVIADVDDSDPWECRPHAPGEIRAALIGQQLTGAFRRGKTMWCETSGPVLGIHLGMSGHIIVTGADGTTSDGGDLMGGRYGRLAEASRQDLTRWDRFRIEFGDGGALRLFDPRRLGRVRLDPDLSDLGPDAALVSLARFRERVGAGRAPLKARLLDQSVIAGVGNLLADEALWQARLSPQRPAGELTDDELRRLRLALRRTIRSATALGGTHTGRLIEHRRPGGRCPRCGTELVRATIGTRTTWWCPREQV